MGMTGPSAGSGGDPHIVLVVDDEPHVRDAVRAFLDGALPGIRVVTAGSMQEGLDVMSRMPVALVVADYRMPGKDGLEFLVEAYKRAPDTPRIMMTAYPDAELAFNSLQMAHVQRFILKPVNPALLRQYVAELLPLD